MKTLPLTYEQLEAEIKELGQKYNKFPDEDLFVLWFLSAYVTDNLEIAASAITNGPNDKGLDAVLIDDPARTVFFVQGKYCKGFSKKTEKRSDVRSFAELSTVLDDPDIKSFRQFMEGADPLVVNKMKKSRQKILNSGYKLRLYYITLGGFSSSVRKEAQMMVRKSVCDAHIDFIDRKQTMLILKDYLDGVAPPIKHIDLEMEKGQGITVNGTYQRYDTRSNIESWVFSMKGDAIAELFELGGVRLFARNIRGFLGGNTSVNRGMKSTLTTEAERFFYYNNGITIICAKAKKESYKGKDILRVNHPQIINGQQTTRMLAELPDKSRNASVLVKVIKVSQDFQGSENEFDSLVSQIVAGTNWQNAIRPSDLMSNDRRQIEIERELRKYRYLYLRKRQSRSEAKSNAGGKYYRTIYKEELAQMVAGCDLDPVIVRSGKDKLFEEELYLQIFPNSDPNYYLPRYWLGRKVTDCAKGFPERGYAKWLVLSFIWSQIAPLVRSSRNAESFRVQAERPTSNLVDPLYSAINKTFVSVLRYYKQNRGSGATAVDVSTFFRHKLGRDKEFQLFWVMKNNKSRKGFEQALKKVGKAILDWNN
tara:strand:- start:203 stop:1981 length:1779 start_codon:yes stop_codon:yes gene_type:complete